MASHPTPPLATKRSQSDASADSAEVLKTLLLLAHHNETPDAESNCLDALLNASKMLENSETEKQDTCTTAVIDLCIDSTKEDASSFVESIHKSITAVVQVSCFSVSLFSSILLALSKASRQFDSASGVSL